MREWLRLRGPLGIWIGATVLAVAAGPFGTMAALPEIWARAGYWAGIVAVSVALSVGASRLAARIGPGPRQLPVWIALTGLIAALVHGTNTFLFDGWGGWRDVLYLVAVVAVVVAAVHGVWWLIDRPGRDEAAAPSPGEALQRKLPLDMRGPLVRLEAQDHYIKVVTTAGHALLLMRLSDAMEGLGPEMGLQVHRSHWVALDAVRRVGGTRAAPVIEMSDGAAVPVSRKRRSAAAEAGLVPSSSG